MTHSLGCAALLLSLAGCEQLGPHQDTARQALQRFCSSDRIGQLLTTPEQIRAGQIVCRAVGLGLGS